MSLDGTGFPDAGMMAIMYSDRYCAQQNSSYWGEICQYQDWW